MTEQPKPDPNPAGKEGATEKRAEGEPRPAAPPVDPQAEKPSVPPNPSGPDTKPVPAPDAPKPVVSPAPPASAAPAAAAPPAKPEAVPPAATSTPATTAPLPASPAVPPKPDAPKDEPLKSDTLIPPSKPPGSERVTQRLTDPNPITPGITGTICPTCGHRNRIGVLVCDNCGTNLLTGTRTPAGTRDLKKDATKDLQPPATMLDTGQVRAIETAGSYLFSEDMVLRIEIEGGATPMLVYPKQEIILGRRDPNTGTLPDVDLTAYAGYRMGVSRRHASIRLADKLLHLSDLGSSNGTFLNGTRLVAHRPYQVRDGDEIRLGQMLLKVFFQSNKKR